MGAGIFLSLRQELVVAVIIFALLLLKIGASEYKSGLLLWLVNAALLVNFAVGLVGETDSVLFNGMFHTNGLIVLEKNMLNLGTLIVSLQAYDWLKGGSMRWNFMFYCLGLCWVSFL